MREKNNSNMRDSPMKTARMKGTSLSKVLCTRFIPVMGSIGLVIMLSFLVRTGFFDLRGTKVMMHVRVSHFSLPRGHVADAADKLTSLPAAAPNCLSQ